MDVDPGVRVIDRGFLALRRAGVVNDQFAVLVKNLRLRIGIEQRADKRKNEHEDQHRKADYGEFIAEKALHNEAAGGQDLNALRIVERHDLFFAVLHLVHQTLALCGLTLFEGLVQTVGISFFHFHRDSLPS